MKAEDTADKGKSQLEKFKDAARDLACDDDEQRFKERLGKLVRQPPAPNPEAD
ncbi:MAG: hypothetical protein ACKO01_13295 [Erythrobacter sp.]